MARIRSVKPELRISALVASWPIEVRYFWVLLWGYLDDKGRGLDLPKTIAGDCFPRDDRIMPATVDRWLDLMTRGIDEGMPGPICRYQVGDRRYLHAVNWHEHQKPNRPTPSRLPQCPIHDKRLEHLTDPPHESSYELLSESPVSSRTPEEGRGGGGELGGGEARSLSARTRPPAPADTGSAPPPPPRTCPQHPDGTERPCRKCGAARQAYEAWAAAQRGRVDDAPTCTKHRGQLASNCALCRSESIERRAS